VNKEVFSRTNQTDDSWETPDYFFNLLNKEFKFTLDPCATSKNAKCNKFFIKKQNGLIQDWKGERVFVNPPFSDIDKWVEKCYKEGQKKDTFVVMILPSRTDTGYLAEAIPPAYSKYIMNEFLRNHPTLIDFIQKIKV